MKNIVAVCVIGLVGLGAVAYSLLAPGQLTINGKSIETTFIVQGGRTFVPLSDVAKALGTTVQKPTRATRCRFPEQAAW